MRPSPPPPAMFRGLHHLGRWMLASLFAATPLLHGLPATSVIVENTLEGDTPAAAALVDVDGTTPLTAGTTANGDGALVALGYFAAAASSAPFTGTWMALTGPESPNLPFRTMSVGDNDHGAAGAFGFIRTQIDFDEGNPATFQNIPPAGTQLAVAIYNGSTLADSTRFNIATNPAWIWKAPSMQPDFADFVSINLCEAGTIWFNGAASARRTAVKITGFPTGGPPARLLNLSTRALCLTGDDVLIPGFVIAGSGSKHLLLRVVGPELLPFGVPAPLPDPQLLLKRKEGQSFVDFAYNDNWGDQGDPAAIAQAAAAAYAFGLEAGSKSSALLLELPAGQYSVIASDTAGGSGIGIVELYDLDPDATTAQLINIATRGYVGSGNDVMIPGFVVAPGGPRTFLIRAVGPALAAHGVSGVLADPQLVIRRREVGSDADERILTCDNWGENGDADEVSRVSDQVYAFPLAAGSKDAAVVLTLSPAIYTVEAGGVDGATGVALVEVYVVP